MVKKEDRAKKRRRNRKEANELKAKGNQELRASRSARGFDAQMNFLQIITLDPLHRQQTWIVLKVLYFYHQARGHIKISLKN